MESLLRYFFLFSLAIATILTNCEAKLHEATEEQLRDLSKIQQQKAKRRARTAANDETLPTAVKKLGDACYSGTSCDSGQFCALSSSGYSSGYYSSFSCKFCNSYNPSTSYDVAEDREYNICGSKNKKLFYGRCLEPMEEKVGDKWFDSDVGDDDYDGDYYDYISGLGFDVDTFCWAKDSKDCCKPAAGAIAGVVVSVVVLITASIIIIAFFCKCCCFKNKQEQPPSV